MTISDYQISSVIKVYTKNMKVKANHAEKAQPVANEVHDDKVQISDEGMKQMLFGRISENMAGRLKRHDEQE